MPIKATNKKTRRLPSITKSRTWLSDYSVLNPKRGEAEKKTLDFNVHTRANNRGDDLPWQTEMRTAKETSKRNKSAVEIRKANAANSNKKRKQSK